MPSNFDFLQPNWATLHDDARQTEQTRRRNGGRSSGSRIAVDWRSEEGDFAGIGGDAVAEEDGVRFGVVIDRDNQLGVAGGVGSGISKHAEAVADLGHFQIVPVDDATANGLLPSESSCTDRPMDDSAFQTRNPKP